MEDSNQPPVKMKEFFEGSSLPYGEDEILEK
jgi:hypothetical protein